MFVCMKGKVYLCYKSDNSTTDKSNHSLTQQKVPCARSVGTFVRPHFHEANRPILTVTGEVNFVTFFNTRN